MRETAERRQLMLEFIIENKKTNLDMLSEKFGVSESTIRRDILILSCSYPIETVRGGGGGIFIAKGYCLGMKYMTEEQVTLLKKLSGTLSEGDEIIMQTIIRTFSKPKAGK